MRRHAAGAVSEVVTTLKHCFEVDYVVLGGGNAKHIEQPPPGTRLGDNRNAILGGFRLWYAAANLSPTLTPDTPPPETSEQWKIA
jgi:hypothetical protein